MSYWAFKIWVTLNINQIIGWIIEYEQSVKVVNIMIF